MFGKLVLFGCQQSSEKYAPKCLHYVCKTVAVYAFIA